MNAISYITNHVTPPKFDEANSIKKDQADAQAHGTVSKSEQSAPEDDEDKNQTKKATKLSLLWSIILFLPNFFIIKPVLFFWYIITFPLNLIEHSPADDEDERNGEEGNSTGDEEKTPSINIIVEEDEEDLAGDEIILQTDAVKGSLSTISESQQVKTIKASTRSSIRSGSTGTALGSRRMGRFLFPKKLIPQSVLNNEKKKILVLDLDETLIHSMSRGTSSSNSSQGHMVEVKFAVSGISSLYFVHKRPYCDLFLSKVAKWYTLVVFTASMKEYADPVIDWLESSFSGSFSQRLYRQDCILRDGVGYIKDLSLISKKSLNEIIIVDNSPISYAMNVDNAIQVEGWISDPTDTDLLNLLPLLEALRFTTDIRNVLSLKSGEQAFNI